MGLIRYKDFISTDYHYKDKTVVRPWMEMFEFRLKFHCFPHVSNWQQDSMSLDNRISYWKTSTSTRLTMGLVLLKAS